MDTLFYFDDDVLLHLHRTLTGVLTACKATIFTAFTNKHTRAGEVNAEKLQVRLQQPSSPHVSTHWIHAGTGRAWLGLARYELFISAVQLRRNPPLGDKGGGGSRSVS